MVTIFFSSYLRSVRCWANCFSFYRRGSEFHVDDLYFHLCILDTVPPVFTILAFRPSCRSRGLSDRLAPSQARWNLMSSSPRFTIMRATQQIWTFGCTAWFRETRCLHDTPYHTTYRHPNARYTHVLLREYNLQKVSVFDRFILKVKAPDAEIGDWLDNWDNVL